MDNYYFIFLAVFLSSLMVRTGYELLKDAQKINPENKFVFAAVFSAMCLLWISWFSLCPSDPNSVDLPSPLRWSGFALFIIGLLLALGALFTLKGLENIDHLVTKGLFAKLRHPMYTGFVLWILGWSIFHGALLTLTIGLIGVANIFYWGLLEERRLKAQFGNVYDQYRLTTWF